MTSTITTLGTAKPGRTTRIRGNRAGFWVYAGLGVVLIASVFPLGVLRSASQ